MHKNGRFHALRNNNRLLTEHKFVDKGVSYPQVIHKNGRFTLSSLKFCEWLGTLVVGGFYGYWGATAVKIARFGAGNPSTVFVKSVGSKQLAND